jgi:hypothetical protein
MPQAEQGILLIVFARPSTPQSRTLLNTEDVNFSFEDFCGLLYLVEGCIGITFDAEIDVDAVTGDAELVHEVPEGEGVFAAGDGDDGGIAFDDEVIFIDGCLYSFFEKCDEVGVAECGLI